jgi:recombination protein RecA
MDRAALASHLLTNVQVQQQLERELLPTGIHGFDSLIGGLPRGAITEIYGPASCGKTTFLHALLANSSVKGEFCALVDASDSFDPSSAGAAGAEFARLLWVRCTGAEQAIRSADLLVHSGGWGVVVLDFGDVRTEMMRKVPLSYWYRFKRAVENTATVFLVLAREPHAKNCAAMSLELPPGKPIWSGTHRDFQLLRGMEVHVAPRKPMRSAGAAFQAKALA